MRLLIAALAMGSSTVPIVSTVTDRTVVVVFRGFYNDPPGTAGMDHLAASLSAARPNVRGSSCVPVVSAATDPQIGIAEAHDPARAGRVISFAQCHE